ncbi:MAG: hypothetical protein ACK6A8_14425 [Planctomycetota bacterium]
MSTRFRNPPPTTAGKRNLCRDSRRASPGCLLLLVFSSLGLGGLGPQLQAQQSFGIPLQLPTQSVFSVDTTVSVPDGGSISLGGNSGSAWSSTRRGGFGPGFATRAVGGTQFAHNASVHVQILSQAELEAELLSQLPPGRTLADYARPTPPRLFLSEPVTRRGTSSAAVASSTAARTAARPAAQPDRPAEARGELVDPNGSRAVQDKADFMSRHIGRKKK